MLHYQITSEYVALTKLDGVGGKTAKSLASHGYKSLSNIANADPSQLSSIKGIGKKLSVKIIPQAAELIANGEDSIYSEELLSESTSRSVAKTSIDPYRLRRSMELSLKGTDGGKYHISGGREDHVVLRQGSSFHCDCLDYEKRREDCKHILCVKRSLGDPEILKMIKRIKEDKNHSIREALPSLWYSVTSKETE